jgi:hypothetical protein
MKNYEKNWADLRKTVEAKMAEAYNVPESEVYRLSIHDTYKELLKTMDAIEVKNADGVTTEGGAKLKSIKSGDPKASAVSPTDKSIVPETYNRNPLGNSHILPQFEKETGKARADGDRVKTATVVRNDCGRLR